MYMYKNINVHVHIHLVHLQVINIGDWQFHEEIANIKYKICYFVSI